MKNYPWIFLLALSFNSHAGPFTVLELPISYQAEPKENVSHGQECKVDQMLANRLSTALYTNPPTGDLQQPPPEMTAPLGDAKMKVKITEALKVEGFAMTGHRYVGVEATLTETGYPLRQTKFMRVCWVAGMKAFSKCDIFEQCADSVSLVLLRWVKNSRYQPEPGPALKDIGKVDGSPDTPGEAEK